MSVTRRRTFAILKVVFAILVWISLGTSPSDPDPRVGRVYPERHIGVVFYLTSCERNLLRGLTAGGFLCFLLRAVCYQLEKRSDP